MHRFGGPHPHRFGDPPTHSRSHPTHRASGHSSPHSAPHPASHFAPIPHHSLPRSAAVRLDEPSDADAICVARAQPPHTRTRTSHHRAHSPARPRSATARLIESTEADATCVTRARNPAPRRTTTRRQRTAAPARSMPPRGRATPATDDTRAAREREIDTRYRKARRVTEM